MSIVAIGISGGVDSAVAALLLRRQGHAPVGVTMTLGRDGDERSVAEARAVAGHLGIPLHVVDLSAVWRREVLGNLVETYLRGQTPNPCVRCNELVKFGLLPRYAFDTLGCEMFATGHYAQLDRSHGALALSRGRDYAKDQSYFLYRVAPEVLSRTLLPLGGFSKEEIRTIAREAKFPIADKVDSQDFCGGDVQGILRGRSECEARPGDIVTSDGRILGRHDGFWKYTIGQRKGMGIGGGIPFYVIGIDAARNRVIVGTKEESAVKSFAVDSAVWLAEIPSFDEELSVKVRSAGEPKGPVRVAVSESGRSCRCEIPSGIAGVAPGQSAVFYRGDRVLGGGIITGRLP